MKKVFFLSLMSFLFVGLSSCGNTEVVEEPVVEVTEENEVTADSTAIAADSTVIEESSEKSEDEAKSDEETE
jgi:uncharacterized protein YcfL